MIGGWDTVIDTQKIKAETVVQVPDNKDVSTSNMEERPVEAAALEVDNVDTPAATEESQAVKSWQDVVTGDTVTHKSLGPGIVVSLDEKYIII